MASFLTKGYPPSGYGVDDFDHRFFYIEKDVCYYVCGMARECMANYLFENSKMEIFADIEWISCIKAFKHNPAVMGFVLEKACIACIWKNGLTVNGTNFKPDEVKFFLSENINISASEGKCTFYIPLNWNQRDIDALLISYQTVQGRVKLCVAPIQVTLNKANHKNSEESFFNNIWSKIKLPEYDDIEIMFVWITCKNDANTAVSFKDRSLRSGNKKINPDYTRVVTGFVNVSKDIHNYLDLGV
jgi:hypothetical protein